MPEPAATLIPTNLPQFDVEVDLEALPVDPLAVIAKLLISLEENETQEGAQQQIISP